MWSFGCVLIEAAVWVSFGRRGRIEFQQRRRDENNEVSPEQRDLGRSDCFHDGKTRLKTVGEVLDLIQRDGRRSDELTPRIVKLVLDHLLVEEGSRYNARLLSTELGKMIRIATDSPDNRLSRHISDASSPTYSHRSQDLRHSQHYAVDEPQSTSTRPQYGTPTPCTSIDSMGQNQTSPTERLPTMGMLQNRGTSVRSQNNPTEPYVNGTRGFHRMDSGQSSMASPDWNGIYGRHSAYSTMNPMNGSHSDVSRRAQTETVGQDNLQRHIGHVQSPSQAWPAHSANTSGTTRSNLTGTPTQSSDHKRTTFPDISMELVGARRAEGGPPKLRRSLPGEDQAMDFLKQRDHVSLRKTSSRTIFVRGSKQIY